MTHVFTMPPPPKRFAARYWTPWLAMLALFAVAVPAGLRADPIAIGTLSYIYADGSSGLPGFEINNFTGVAASCGATVTGPNTYCYPVTTPLAFDGVTLTVNYSDSNVNGGATQVLTVSVPSFDDGEFSPTFNYLGTTGVDYGDGAYAFQIPVASVANGGTVTVLSATVNGTFAPSGPLVLTDATDYFSSGTFSASLTDFACTDSDYSCYFSQADLVTQESGAGNGPGNTVPEPASLWLLLGGLGTCALLRRRGWGSAAAGRG